MIPEPRRQIVHDLLLQSLLEDLWQVGAIEIETTPGKGFKLKHHAEHPHLPLSPIKLQLRIPENGGSLSPDMIRRMAMVMAETLPGSLAFPIHAIAGLPKAGVPIGEALAEILVLPHLRLQKTGEGDERRIEAPDALLRQVHAGSSVLIVDDLITKAASKLEGIRALQKLGYNVSDVLVFCDREQGGRDELLNGGILLHRVVTLRSMLKFYERRELLSPDDNERILKYLASH